MKNRIQDLLATKTSECHKCMDLILQIRRGEITGVVLSCHPLDDIADEELRQYIESEKLM